MAATRHTTMKQVSPTWPYGIQLQEQGEAGHDQRHKAVRVAPIDIDFLCLKCRPYILNSHPLYLQVKGR